MPKKPVTIFVADDDPAILESVQMLLEINEFQVVTSSGTAILQDIHDTLPDLILLDVWMGNLDGREICAQIKASKPLKDIPVILISASKDIAKSYAAVGAESYVEKPFDISTLLTEIEKNLRK